MYLYRISKYDPSFRKENGAFTKNEWTSLSDVSKKYNGKVFTMDEYSKVESNYLSFVEDILNIINIKELEINELEDYHHKCNLNNGTYIKLDEIKKVVKDCLRELYWCKLKMKDFYISFGYDFYLYIYGDLTSEQIKTIALKHSLFVEELPIDFFD